MAKKKKTLQELSIEELNSKKKTLKLLVGLMMAMIIVFAGLIVYYFIQDDWGTDKLPAVSSIVMLSIISMLSNKQILAIDKELAERNQQENS